MRRFPVGKWGHQTLTFYPAPYKAPVRAFAALLFPWSDSKILVCDILDRGWCVPSGRVEPTESSLDAALREAQEEAGAEVSDVQYIGCNRIADKSQIRWADCYVGKVVSMGEISRPEESLGCMLMGMDQMAEMYHLWNDLTEQVVAHSLVVLTRATRR